jgi:diacylglycerol kinase
MKIRLYESKTNSDYHPLQSLKCAINGLFLAFKQEANLSIQVFIGVLFFLFNMFFGQQILAIANLVFMGAVISFEMINTIIENICDLIEPNYNQKIKVIKDMSAGAVLVMAILWLLIILFGVTKIALKYRFGIDIG